MPYYVTAYIQTNGTTEPNSIVVTYKFCLHFQFHFYSPMCKIIRNVYILIKLKISCLRVD